jgi:hypothetical protein
MAFRVDSEGYRLALDGTRMETTPEDAGADPSHTAYTMNGHFGDPDLICKDQAVFLGKVNQYRAGADGNNADVFGDSVDVRASNPADNKITLDTTRYFGSVPPEMKLNVARTVLGSAETSAARQAIIEGYLLSFDPSQRAAKATELRSQFGGAPEAEGNRSPVLADIDAVKLKLGIAA